MTKCRVNLSPIRRLIVETPEVEAADTLGIECPRKTNGAIQDLVLLVESKTGFRFVALGRELRFRRAFPIDFEKRARNVGDAQLVFVQRALCFGEFVVVQQQNIFVPKAPQLDPFQAEFIGRDVTGMVQIVRNLVIDYTNTKGDLPIRLRARERPSEAGGRFPLRR